MTSTETSALKQCREYSNERCCALRKEIVAIFPAGSSDTVLVCGSIARREAGGPSDVDYFLVSGRTLAPQIWQSVRRKILIGRINDVVKGIGLRKPSKGGPFADGSARQSIIQNIGGTKDSNTNITQRMLLLLEGDWLFNEEGFRDLRREILHAYVKDDIPEQQVTLFLLNDIIRYWRTICVDYEYKTTEEGKPRAIRNVKLVFSRKLLYASGLFSVALTADMPRESKVKRLEELFDLPPLDRVVHICGEAATEKMLRSYEAFLDCISDDEKRRQLESLGKNGRDDPLYREMKDEGHQFALELMKLFETRFDPAHPIRRAIIY